MYYLQTRYYDANICRFINADSVSFLGANGDLNSYNLYAYCSNDPVNYTDPTGHAINPIVAGFILGAAIGIITSIFVQTLKADGDITQVDLREVAFDAFVGGLNGALAASDVSFGAAIALGALIGGASKIAKDYLIEKKNSISPLEILDSVLLGCICGAIAGAGANNAKDGAHLGKFIKSYKILNNTIINGTKSAIARQSSVMMHHAKNLLISGGKYLFSNFISIIGSNAGE
jgi:hypothetical protein